MFSILFGIIVEFLSNGLLSQSLEIPFTFRFLSSTFNHGQWLENANEPTQAEIVKELLGARDAMLQIRHQMRKMGEAAGIPVSSPVPCN